MVTEIKSTIISSGREAFSSLFCSQRPQWTTIAPPSLSEPITSFVTVLRAVVVEVIEREGKRSEDEPPPAGPCMHSKEFLFRVQLCSYHLVTLHSPQDSAHVKKKGYISKIRTSVVVTVDCIQYEHISQ